MRCWLALRLITFHNVVERQPYVFGRYEAATWPREFVSRFSISWQSWSFGRYHYRHLAFSRLRVAMDARCSVPLPLPSPDRVVQINEVNLGRRSFERTNRDAAGALESN